ncbi:MAG: ABC transporter permease subunit, partial [Chloroflexi bacterium]|nr:ABC transporter permease subunit [Chloroflexota bacterium]
MTTTLLALTAHQLLGRRRGILIALMALLPIGLALLFRLAGEGGEPSQFAADMVGGLVITLLLPSGALVFGTSALGAEIEDGTIVYLLAKPVARWRIVVVKAAVASLATAALVVPATLLTVVIVLDGLDAEYLWWGAAAAANVGPRGETTRFFGGGTGTRPARGVG